MIAYTEAHHTQEAKAMLEWRLNLENYKGYAIYWAQDTENGPAYCAVLPGEVPTAPVGYSTIDKAIIAASIRA